MQPAAECNILRGMKRVVLVYALPLALLLAVTLPHLGQGDFRTDTARYAAVGLQAWRDPALFWTPHLQPGTPYFNKPPLAFWIHGWFLQHLGVSLVAARLPSILAALAVVAMTVGIARRRFGSGTALAAGCVLALTYEFFRRTREISLDLWQLAFMMAGVWLYLRAATARRPGAAAFVAGIPLGLALLCKPFMALLALPALLIADTRPRLALPLLAGLAAVALPWHASMVWLHGDAFLSQYLGREVLQRARGAINAEPWWYYALEMGRSYWPWWLAWAAGIWSLLRHSLAPRRRRGLCLALAWIALWAVALSLFPDKRPRYELPLYPAMAIVAGHGLVTLPWRGFRRWRRRYVPAAVMATALAGLVAALLPLRIQAPPDADLAAVAEWCRAHPETPLYSGALSTNDDGYFYLKLGRWPAVVAAGDRKRLPEGALVIYTRDLKPEPAAAETVVFRAGPYCVTRNGSGIQNSEVRIQEERQESRR